MLSNLIKLSKYLNSKNLYTMEMNNIISIANENLLSKIPPNLLKYIEEFYIFRIMSNLSPKKLVSKYLKNLTFKEKVDIAEDLFPGQTNGLTEEDLDLELFNHYIFGIELGGAPSIRKIEKKLLPKVPLAEKVTEFYKWLEQEIENNKNEKTIEEIFHKSIYLDSSMLGDPFFWELGFEFGFSNPLDVDWRPNESLPEDYYAF